MISYALHNTFYAQKGLYGISVSFLTITPGDKSLLFKDYSWELRLSCSLSLSMTRWGFEER